MDKFDDKIKNILKKEINVPQNLNNKINNALEKEKTNYGTLKIILATFLGIIIITRTEHMQDL